MAEKQITVNGDKAVINQIQQNQTENDQMITLVAPFGVDDENVQIYYNTATDSGVTPSYTPWGSLRNFFQEWLSFKNIWNNFLRNAKFIQYSSEEPDSNSVKVWFDTSEDQNNDN